MWPAPSPDPWPVHEVERLRASLAAGSSVVQALDELAGAGGPWASGATQALVQVRSGVSVQVAVDRWAAGRDPGVALTADALAIAGQTGGSLARAVGSVVDTMRERGDLHREVRALTAQARASAVLVAVTPIVFAVGVAVADVRVRGFFASPMGVGCLAVGCCLDVAGAGWMARIVRRAR